jgi:molybdate transport system substrate-binding protein
MTKWPHVFAAACASAIVSSIMGPVMTATAANAADITVISSTAMREALEALIPAFERASGHKVTISFYSGAQLPVRVKEGEPADLVVTTPDSIDDLVKAGKVVAGSRVDFVRSGVGVAVRAGAPKPDIGTADGFRRALLAAKTVGISKGPSGVYLMSVLARLGIADEVKAKAVVPELGQRVGALVAKGESEIGIQQVTELLPIPGIDFVGPLPAELQTVIVYATVRTVGAKQPAAADALAKFLSSETVAPVIRKMGLEPG